MKIARTVSAVRSYPRVLGESLVLVPTMGALHHGHAELLRYARRLAGKKGKVVASIFVNPTQFGPKEDFSRYPRPWKNDLKACRDAGVDLVFAPSAGEMYFDDRSVFIDESTLSRNLCGASRGGHFRGVCTVVAKLFLIVQPEIAVFGEKDWQQLAIIRRMVRDLNFPVKVVGHPTVREADGLATSSRNAYLTPEERQLAPQINQALRQASSGATAGQILKTGRRLLGKIPGARVDYLELVDAENLADVTKLKGPMRLATAVFLGKTRLIDNIPVAGRT
ncbi:pantoate--beta-alanine ligase [soil metagenome]